MTDDRRATESYRDDDLLVRLKRALGVAPDDLARDDFAAVEEFHLGGRRATRKLADLADLDGDRVLDVGCGIGGPARTLAVEYDCRVVGLDRVAGYPRTARWLSNRVGVDGAAFLAGDATALPVSHATFDAVWLQHAGMNVPAKNRLFAESFRALRPGGLLAIHEVCAGSETPRYPVPWATDSAGSHLLDPEELERAATDAGFERKSWTDVTDESLTQVRAVIDAHGREEGPTSVIDLLVDADPQVVFENLATNLESRRISVVMGVFRRPPDAD